MRSKYSPIARRTAGSSSTSNRVSAIEGLEAGPHQHGQRARQEPRLEWRRARQLAVELYGTRHSFRQFDAHGAAAAPPHALELGCAVAPKQHLEHGLDTLRSEE